MNISQSFENIFIFEEGMPHLIKKSLNNESLLEYFDQSEGVPDQYKSQFVGFILRKDEIFISFPKKYGEILNIDEEASNLAKLLFCFSTNLYDNHSGDNKNNFPVDSYLNICRYYIEHGLYFQQNKEYSKGYMKKINWNKTINSSDKIITNNNLLFFPFVIENSNESSVFLTECMKKALFVGYEKFGRIFNVGVPYFNNSNLQILENTDYVLSQLHKLRISHNNDRIKKLIVSIIDFIEWMSSDLEQTFFATKNFELIWQNMINYILDKKLKIEETGYTFDFDVNENNHFHKEFSHKIQARDKNFTRNFKVRYDHLLIEENSAYLFDSKYYLNEVTEFDYKQFSYYYILNDYLYRKKQIHNAIIYNGLILPTDSASYTFTHFDTIGDSHHNFLQNIKIEEHYLNIKEVIKAFLTK